ncbi:MAG: SLBB domain-containing protein [Fibrobacterales bacterium]
MKKSVLVLLILSVYGLFAYGENLTPEQMQQLSQMVNNQNGNPANNQGNTGGAQQEFMQRDENGNPKQGSLKVLGLSKRDSTDMILQYEEQIKLDSLRSILDSAEIDTILVSDEALVGDSINLSPYTLDSLVFLDSLFHDSLFNDSLSQDSIDRKFRIYGLEVFEQEVTIESNVSDVPEDYKVVEGDKIHLQLWGSQNIEKTYTVGKGGDVFFDLINKKIQAIGLTYRKLKTIVQRAMKKVGSQGDVSLLAVHAYRIHFSGNVKNHGSEVVPPYYPFWKVLLLTKGPNNYGSLRNIQVIRNNKKMATFDLYAFLETGKMPKITLQNDDVIYFGQRENVVDVKGFVRREGVYELKIGETFDKLVTWAAGLKNDAPVSSVIEIRRPVPLNKRTDPRKAFEYLAVDLTKDYSKIEMADGDEAYANVIEALSGNFVYLKGDGFKNPGKYTLPKEGTTAFTFINLHGGLRPGFKPKGEVVSDLDTNKIAVSIDLTDSDFLKSIILQDKDTISAYHKMQDLDTAFRKISIRGYVREPIEVPYAEGMTLAAALRQGLGIKAGGLSEVYVKFKDELGKVSYLKVDLVKDDPESVILQQNTEVFTFDTDKMDPKLPIVVLAPDKEPLTLDYSEDLNLDVIVKRLEGLPFDIDSNNVEINKPLFDSENAFETRTYKLAKGPLFNSTLISAGDVIIFRRDIKKEDAGYVIMRGEFRTPGKYVLTSAQESMESVIFKAGGVRPRANIFSLRLQRRDGIEPIPVDAEFDGEDVEFEQTWYLNSGDTVTIDKNNNTVEISGSVLNPTKVSYRESYDWEDYIDYGAGGALDTADVRKAYVRYPNGKSLKLSQGFFSSPEIVPGAKIVVPEKPFIPPDAPEPQTQWGIILPGIAAIITALGAIVTTAIAVSNSN